MNYTDFRKNLADALDIVAKDNERIIVHKREKAVAALVSIEDLKLLELLEDRMDMKEAKRMLKKIESEGTDSWDDVKAELGV